MKPTCYAGYLFVPFLLITKKVLISEANSLNETKQLYKDMLKGYEKNIFPIDDHRFRLRVGLTFWLKTINDFDDVNEFLTITATIWMNWTDPSLTWDPKSYGNMEHLRLPSSAIWIPWLYLMNSVDQIEPIGRDADFLVTIYSNGTVVDGPGSILKSNCPTDMSRFPFDVQICTLRFVMWSAENAFEFIANHDDILLDIFSPNPHWTLVHHVVSCEYDRESAAFLVRLSLRRNPLYYMIVIILPMLILCLLNPLVFVYPIDSGERMGLCITILLAFSFFLTLAANVVPSSSNPLCFLLLIMFLINVVSAMIVVGVIWTSTYYFSDNINKDSVVYRYFGPKDVEYSKPSDDISLTCSIMAGKDISYRLDRACLVVSYTCIFLLIIIYIMYVSF